MSAIAGFSEAPHYPYATPIDAYGANGFRFAGMSHRGSLLCLPQGIWAWPVSAASEIGADHLQGVLANSDSIDTLLIGTGNDVWLAPGSLREQFRAVHVVIDVMQTGPAVRVYNIMVGERRRVAAALIAVP